MNKQNLTIWYTHLYIYNIHSYINEILEQLYVNLHWEKNDYFYFENHSFKTSYDFNLVVKKLNLHWESGLVIYRVHQKS